MFIILPITKIGGTSISGRVLFPPEITELRNGSCLSVSTRKLIKCKQEKCTIPPVASKTWEMVEYAEGGIPYSLFLPIDSPGSYLISAVINNVWCKSRVQGEWIRYGDFYNGRVHDFEMKSPPMPIGKNIQTSVYVEDPSQTKVTVLPVIMVPQASNESLQTISPSQTHSAAQPVSLQTSGPPQRVAAAVKIPETMALRPTPALQLNMSSSLASM